MTSPLVSKCTSCAALTMLPKCPKCGGVTAPYHMQRTPLSVASLPSRSPSALSLRQHPPTASSNPQQRSPFMSPSSSVSAVPPAGPAASRGPATSSTAAKYRSHNFVSDDAHQPEHHRASTPPASRADTAWRTAGLSMTKQAPQTQSQSSAANGSALLAETSTRAEVAALREALQRKEVELGELRGAHQRVVAAEEAATAAAGEGGDEALDEPYFDRLSTYSAPYTAHPAAAGAHQAALTPTPILSKRFSDAPPGALTVSRHHASSVQPAVATNGVLVATQPSELLQAWQSNAALDQVHAQLDQLRGAHHELLLEKDTWSLQILRIEEQHHAALAELEGDRRRAKDELTAALRKVSLLEADLVESQRKRFDAEQESHRASEAMFAVAAEMAELQRAVAAAKSTDRNDVDRLHEELNAARQRAAERDDDNRRLQLKLSDARDQLETVQATRTTLQQQLAKASQDKEESEAQRQSLERQLSLAVVEQRALGEESRDLRERLRESASQRKAAETQASELEARLKDLENRVVSQAALNTSAELNVLRDQLDRLTRDIAASRQERALALDAAEALRTEIRRLSSANAALDDEVVTLRKTNDALGSDLLNMRQEIQSLMQQSHEQRKDDEVRHKASISELQDVIHALRAEKQQVAEATERRLREVEAERAAHHRTRLELKESLAELTDKHEAVTSALRRAEAELERKQTVSPTKDAAERALRDGHEESLKASLVAAEQALHDVRLQLDAMRLERDGALRALQNERAAHANLNELVEAISREFGLLHKKEELPAAARAMLRERNAAVEEKESCTARASRDAVEYHDRLREMRSTLEHVQSQLDRYKQQATDLVADQSSRAAESDRRVQLAEDSFKTQVARLEATHQAALSAAEAERLRLQQALHGAQGQHRAVEESLHAKEGELRRWKEKHELVMDQLAAAERSMLGMKQRESDLVAAVQEAHLQLESAKGSERQQQQAADAAKEEAARLKRDAEVAAQMLAEALDNERRAHEADRMALARDVAVAREELNAERDRRIMEADVARVAERRCSESMTQLEHVKLERDQLTREAATMRRSQTAITEAYETRIAELELELQEVRASLQRASSRAATLTTKTSASAVSPFTLSPSVPSLVDRGAEVDRGEIGGLGATLRPQEPQPSLPGLTSAARIARERNDAMLAQLREQRSLSGSTTSVPPGGAWGPSRAPTADPVPSLRTFGTAPAS